MDKHLFWSAWLLLTACAIGDARGDEALWRPYVDLHTRAGTAREVGQANLFAPLWQDDASLLFADVRGQWTDEQSAEGNFGLAYREILACEKIVGVYSFYDFLHSRHNNNFQQATVGGELLDVNSGLRLNGYLPDRDADQVTGVPLPGEERAYYGVDLEYERMVLACDRFCDAEIWATAGVFHFDNDTPGFENMTGPRGRLELRLFDLPLLGVDSRVALTGEVENDDVRGTVGSGAITLRIPLGRRSSRSSGCLAGLDRRMVTPIVRDIDIITNHLPGAGLSPNSLGPAQTQSEQTDEGDDEEIQQEEFPPDDLPQ